ATLGVLAKQRSLRSAEYLHAVDVGEIEDGPKHGAEIHVVDVEADTRLEGVLEVVLSDAADRNEGRFAEAGASRLDVDVRSGVRDVGHVHVTASVYLLCGDGGDRNGRRLQVLALEASGNDDFAQAFVCRR